MHDLVIIGGGPAGMTAALYAGRFKLNTLVFEKMSCGGQILLSSSIENYPGFPGGVSTFELMDRFKKQVDELGVTVENKEVLEVSAEGGFYSIRTETGAVSAKAVVIASGAQPKKLGVKGEDKFIGRGVSYCGTCDGPLFKDKDIVVVGGGDRALEDAIFLSAYARSIKLVHRRNELRAAGILVEKARGIPKIEFVLESVVEEISGEGKVSAVKIKNVRSSASSEIRCQGVFIFVGIIPDTSFVKNILETDEFGFIITTQAAHTSKAGIFACGDCVKKELYQVVNACGEAAVAVDAAHKYLMKL